MRPAACACICLLACASVAVAGPPSLLPEAYVAAMADELSGETAHEALNFADGRRNARQITDELSAEYGPVPLALVVEYLQALKAIGVVQ